MKTDRSTSGESGFSLVEIVVSMALIGVIAISILPVIMQSLTASSVNITTATATQIVNNELDTARATVSNCAELAAFVGEVPPTVTDSQSVVLRVNRSAEACTDTTLNAVSVTITVTRNDLDTVTAGATTLLTVDASEPEPTPSETPEP